MAFLQHFVFMYIFQDFPLFPFVLVHILIKKNYTICFV